MAGDEERRGPPRRKTFEPVSITIDGCEHRSHLLDLSTHGAKVHCTTVLHVDQQVVLRSPGIVRRASVEWTKPSGSAGLSFNLALPAAAIVAATTKK